MFAGQGYVVAVQDVRGRHASDGEFRVSSAQEGLDGYDTVSFAGFGMWSRDRDAGLHLVCAQISEAAALPYVSIQIGGGRVANVDTKPPRLEEVRP